MLSAGTEKGREPLVRLGYDRFRHGSHGSSVMKFCYEFVIAVRSKLEPQNLFE